MNRGSKLKNNFLATRWVWTAATGITLSVFFIQFYLRGYGIHADGLGYFAPLRSLVFDGDLDVSNEFRFFASTFSHFSHRGRWPFEIPVYSKYTIGTGLILAPFFLLGHVLALLLNILGIQTVALDGLSWPYELTYTLGSLSLGIFGLYLGYRTARSLYGSAVSSMALLGVWFGSPLLYYLTLGASMSHAVSTAVVSLLIYVCVSSNGSRLRSGQGQILIGFLLGLAALVRPQDILFLTIPAILMLLSPELKLEKKLRGILLIIIMAAITTIPQLGIYWSQYGTVFGSPYFIEGQWSSAGSSFNWTAPQVIPVLFSGFRGLFIWHPLILLSFFGLLINFSNEKAKKISFLAAFGFQLYLISVWHCWWQGESVGARMFSSCTFIFIFGLASFWNGIHKRWNLAIPLVLTILLIGWSSLLTAQYLSRLIPPEQPVAVTTLLHNQTRVITHLISQLWGKGNMLPPSDQ